MTEHYKHHEPNGTLDSLSNHYSHQSKSARYESSFVFLLIAIGIFGLYYIPKSPFADRSPSSENRFSPRSPSEVAIMPPSTSKGSDSYAEEEQKQVTSKRQLFIVGEKIAGQTIFFTIDSYDEQAAYQLELGNGETLEVDHKTVSYTYAEAGSYQLNLRVSYRGEEALIHSEQIQIKASDQWVSSPTAGNGF